MNPSKAFNVTVGFLLGFLFLSVFPAHGVAEDTPDTEIGIKKKGVVHNIADDRQVKRIQGGIYEPEGLDIYLKRHLDKIYDKMDSMQSEIASLKSEIEKLNEASEPETTQTSKPEETSRARLIQ